MCPQGAVNVNLMTVALSPILINSLILPDSPAGEIRTIPTQPQGQMVHRASNNLSAHRVELMRHIYVNQEGKYNKATFIVKDSYYELESVDLFSYTETNMPNP